MIWMVTAMVMEVKLHADYMCVKTYHNISMSLFRSLLSSQYKLRYFFVMSLDITSHWLQMYSSAVCGQHHKSEAANANRFFLVRWFYGNYLFFGYLCVGAELFYVLHYASYHMGSGSGSGTISLLMLVAAPAVVLKNCVNAAQMASAAMLIAEMDANRYNERKT